MATRWWTLTAPTLLDTPATCPEPTEHPDLAIGIIRCKGHGLTVCAYGFDPDAPLTGHLYYSNSISYNIHENATDEEITALATHARHIINTTDTIENRITTKGNDALQ